MPDDNSMHKPILPADIWNYILGTYLPAYSRVGSHSFHKTCKALSQKGFPKLKRPSVKDVIDSYKTPEDALNILNDPGLCEQFTFSELLSVAGTHPSITEHLLKFSMPVADFDSLGSNSAESASLIDKKYLNKLPSYVKYVEDDLKNARNPIFYFSPKHVDKNALYKMRKDALQIYAARCASVAMAVHRDPKLLARIFEESTGLINEQSVNVPNTIFSPYVCVNQLHLELIKAQVARGIKFNEAESKLIRAMGYRVSSHKKIIKMANKLRQQARERVLDLPWEMKRSTVDEIVSQESNKKPKRG